MKFSSDIALISELIRSPYHAYNDITRHWWIKVRAILAYCNYLKLYEYCRHSVEVLDNLLAVRRVEYLFLCTESLHGLVNYFVKLSCPRNSTRNRGHVSRYRWVFFLLLILLSDDFKVPGKFKIAVGLR